MKIKVQSWLILWSVNLRAGPRLQSEHCGDCKIKCQTEKMQYEVFCCIFTTELVPLNVSSHSKKDFWSNISPCLDSELTHTEQLGTKHTLGWDNSCKWYSWRMNVSPAKVCYAFALGDWTTQKLPPLPQQLTLSPPPTNWFHFSGFLHTEVLCN